MVTISVVGGCIRMAEVPLMRSWQLLTSDQIEQNDVFGTRIDRCDRGS